MNNKLTDKGWKSMQALLDREMPVKKRRRFAFWWFAALFLPLALYGSWLIWNTGNTEQPGKPVPAQALARAGKPVSKQADALSPDKKEAAVLPLQTEQEHSTIAPAPVPQSPVTLVSIPASSGINENIAPVAVPEVLQPGKTPVLATQALASELHPINIDHTIKVKQPGKRPLPTKPIHKAIKPFEFAATSIVSTDEFRQANGFSTGLTFDWRFAKKWGLRSGLFYQIYTPESSSKPVASVESDSYSSKVGEKVEVLDAYTGTELQALSGNIAYSDSLEDNVLIPVNRLQKIEIPVAISYQLTRSWKWYAGFSVARNISAKADRLNYSGEYILRVTDRNAADGVSQLSTGKFSTWSGDAMLGTAWRVSKVFELGLTTKMPLSRFPRISKQDSEKLNFADPGAKFAAANTQNKRKPQFSLFASIYF